MTANPISCDDIFQCRQCGKCCAGFGGTYVTDKEAAAIAGFVGMDRHRFIDTCCVPSGSKQVLSQKDDGTCIFFDQTKQCTIHPVKPRMCRAWPFIPAVVRHPENWNAMAGSCMGMKTDVPEKDLIRIVQKEIENMQTAGD